MGNRDLAVIADVHGNVWALRAVLEDIARRGIEQIINLGDNANGPLDPAGAVALLRSAATFHVRGNGDRMTGEGGPEARQSARFARERLNDAAIDWLRTLPLQVHEDGWTAFHAAPTNDDSYFLEAVAGEGLVLAPAEQLARQLEGISSSLVLCAHSHIPRLVRLPDGRTIVNPGSVGLPAYEDRAPQLHRVEMGSPHARYAVVRRRGAEWDVEFRCVRYDWGAAAAAARAAGWSPWAHCLEFGYCARATPSE